MFIMLKDGKFLVTFLLPSIPSREEISVQHTPPFIDVSGILHMINGVNNWSLNVERIYENRQTILRNYVSDFSTRF